MAPDVMSLHVVLAFALTIAKLEFPLPPRHLCATAIASADFRPQLLDISLAFLRPVEDKMAAEQVSMLERRVRAFGLVPRGELEERKPARAMVELAG